MDEKRQPALWVLLNSGLFEFCEGCPFASLDTDKNSADDVANDPTEAYYRCSLLNVSVWGESPKCTMKDWQRKAREELSQDGERK